MPLTPALPSKICKISGSNEISKAAREIVYEHLNHSIFRFYGLPRLATSLVRTRIPNLLGKNRKLSAMLLENAEDVAVRHGYQLYEKHPDIEKTNNNARLAVQSAIQNHLLISFDVNSTVNAPQSSSNLAKLYGNNYFVVNQEDAKDHSFVLFFDLSIANFPSNLYNFSTRSFDTLKDQANQKVACEMAKYMYHQIFSSPAISFRKLPNPDFQVNFLRKMETFSKGVIRFYKERCEDADIDPGTESQPSD